MLGFLFGFIGAIVSLVGWFGFKSTTLLIVGFLGYVIETIIEWKSLNAQAKTMDVIVFAVGSIVGLIIKVPFWICGLVALSIYSLIIGLISLPSMLSEAKLFFDFMRRK